MQLLRTWAICSFIRASTCEQSGRAVVKTHPGREDLLTAAYGKIQQSYVQIRVPAQAGASSTFGRFLQGHSEPYIASRHGFSTAAGHSPVVQVVDFGADPTCRRDSVDAFEAAVDEALRHHHGRYMGYGIKDLGGVTIDLQGGDYLLSRPVIIPPGVGNLRIVGGTVRAAPRFPGDAYLIEVGGNSTAVGKDSTNEKIGLQDMMFDGSYVAKGGLRINGTTGGNVGPDMFFVHFNHAGYTVNGGHEIMLHQAWFGKTYPSDPNKTDPDLVHGSVAMEINGYDHVVSDAIAFGAETGLRVTGGSAIIEGVHTWNDATAHGGQGIVLEPQWFDSGINRVDKCYLDFNSLIVQDPKFVSITNTFFLGMGNLVLKSKTGRIQGLSLVANEWVNKQMKHNETVVLDERATSFTSVKDLVMLGNFADDKEMTSRAVTATKALMQRSATKWVFDFSDVFIFPHIPIRSVTYSISGVGFTRHMARPAVGQQVTVETEDAVDATVTVTASQAEFSPLNGPRTTAAFELIV